MLKFLFFLTFVTLSISQTPNPALPCPSNPAECVLPNCRCSSNINYNEGIDQNLIPQFVFMTFDDAITVQNYELYQQLFTGKRNPNGSPYTATFFISHEYTDYTFTHQLWRNNHQISLHSISHVSNTTYWANLSEEGWDREVKDQRELVSRFANIPTEDIKGLRAPFLQTGGNEMYTSLSKNGFEWDCSLPTQTFSHAPNILWPYTRDFASIQDCIIPPCPTASFEEFWTVPMVSWTGDNGFFCSMMDFCQPFPENEDEAFELIKRNFLRHYEGNRAPIGLFTHAAWLSAYPAHRGGFNRFMTYLQEFEDVYVVTVSQALEWMKNPVSSNAINASYPEYLAVKNTRPDGCTRRNSCHYPNENTPVIGERYLTHCHHSCPTTYPYLNNQFGEIPLP